MLTQASSAVVTNREAKAKEEVQLAWAGVDAEYWENWAKNTSVDSVEYFEEEYGGKTRLNKYLEGYTGKVINGPIYNSETEEFMLEYLAYDQEIVYTFAIKKIKM